MKKFFKHGDKVYPIIKEYDNGNKHVFKCKNPYEKSFSFKLRMMKSHKYFEINNESAATYYYSYQHDFVNWWNPLTYIGLFITILIGTVKELVKTIKDIFINKALESKHSCLTYRKENCEIIEK